MGLMGEDLVNDRKQSWMGKAWVSAKTISNTVLI